jgi:hypothetical protein
MGKNAASVLPEAVAAEMMTSVRPFKIGPIASDWLERSSPHFCSQIQRCMPG